MRKSFVVLGLTLVFSWFPMGARATWSVVAVDEETGQVGVAVATCINNELFNARGVPRLVPGIGAMAAQAIPLDAVTEEAVRLIAAGQTPSEVLSAITDPEFDASSTRQYGIAILGESPANFSGTDVVASFVTSGLRTGSEFHVAVQGNLLVGVEVLDDAVAAFEALGGAVTLADRLIHALNAGAQRGGDGRCSVAQSALSAALVVASPGDEADNPSIEMTTASEEGDENPVTALLSQYEEQFGTITSREEMSKSSDSGCTIGRSSDRRVGAPLALSIGAALLLVLRRRRS